MTEVSANEENVVSLKAVRVDGLAAPLRTWERYFDALEPLLDEARKQGSPHVLLDVLSYVLVELIADLTEPYVKADALRNLGAHVRDLTPCGHCEAEAQWEEEAHQPQ